MFQQQQKDYYRILHVPLHATPAQLKAAYRKLAFLYHPDKNNNDVLTEAVFKEINEAYAVLSDNNKRKKYNQQFRFSSGNTSPTSSYKVSANSILQQAIELNRIVSVSNPFTLNKDALLFALQDVLSEYNIAVVLLEKNQSISKQLINQLLAPANHLSYRQVKKMIPLLLQLSANDYQTEKTLHYFIRRKKSEDRWNRYKILIVSLIAVLLCLVIFLLNVHSK